MASSVIQKDSIRLKRTTGLSNNASETIPLVAGTRYLLITTATGYGIQNGKFNMYLLGTAGNYANKIRLSDTNAEAMTVNVDDKVNLIVTDTSGQSRFWLFVLS